MTTELTQEVADPRRPRIWRYVVLAQWVVSAIAIYCIVVLSGQVVHESAKSLRREEIVYYQTSKPRFGWLSTVSEELITIRWRATWRGDGADLTTNVRRDGVDASYDDKHVLSSCYGPGIVPVEFPQKTTPFDPLSPGFPPRENRPELAPYETEEIRAIVAQASAFVESCAERGEMVLPQWWVETK
ncbi:MAG: hypothetical protein AAF581_23420 [Planctomycetota bacterium]